MKIILLGDTGSLGRQFKKLFLSKKVNFYGINRRKKNFNLKFKNIESIINQKKPHLIINCIAITGLVYCQNRKKEAKRINTILPIKILKIIKNTKINYIHFSTEAVFKGAKLNKIYSEKDHPKPETIYGKSKYEADKKILKQANTYVIRLPLLFGPTHKNQIVSKLLRSLKLKRKTYI